MGVFGRVAVGGGREGGREGGRDGEMVVLMITGFHYSCCSHTS